ncbi:RNA polymerase sigma factor [Nostoc ellipsosporum NOK]|nr:RNA polymerase sigma factor [Nostoc ellipsosporum NOK]
MEQLTEQEFLRLIEAHKGILHKVARMYMDTPQDREDLHQEMIIQLWKSCKSFKGNSEFSSWMYRVAINTAISYFRKEKRRQDTVPYEQAAERENENYDPTKDRQLEIFYQAVQQLNPVEKAIIFYFMEGLSHRETASQLGISEINARVKLNRTKEKLQLIIKQAGYES